LERRKKSKKTASEVSAAQVEALLSSFAGLPETCFLVGHSGDDTLVCARIGGRVHALRIDDEAVNVACIRYLTARSATIYETLQDAERA
jgi:hypothetical protein